ncbi:MAG: hypothetical protein CMH81_07105 [Nitrospiraceae bacterium]|nr:hypothetical protein [Nitrospiraceae bacterium]
MKRILYLITNTVEPPLQAILHSQSERADLRVTVVTAQKLTETIVSADTPIFSLLSPESHSFNASASSHSPQILGYDGLMDLIFETDEIVTW